MWSNIFLIVLILEVCATSFPCQVILVSRNSITNMESLTLSKISLWEPRGFSTRLFGWQWWWLYTEVWTGEYLGGPFLTILRSVTGSFFKSGFYLGREWFDEAQYSDIWFPLLGVGSLVSHCIILKIINWKNGKSFDCEKDIIWDGQ